VSEPALKTSPTMPELKYRPNHFDDWGWIRNADDSMYAYVHRPEAFEGEFDECRIEETGPFAEIAQKIIFYDDILQRMAVLEAALEKIASPTQTDSLLWWQVEARQALSASAAITYRHSDNVAVDRFFGAMKAKLAAKRAEGRGGWDDKDGCSNAQLSRMLAEHVAKGDPIDVANFAMMIHQRCERINADGPVLADLNVKLPLKHSQTDIGVILDADHRDVFTVDSEGGRDDREVEKIAGWIAGAVNTFCGFKAEVGT
jgi:hypothetical protein